MSNLAEFFHMGGYAFYVWLSFGSAFALVGGIVFWSWREWVSTRQRVFARARRQEKNA